jgi:hypothetical protein
MAWMMVIRKCEGMNERVEGRTKLMIMEKEGDKKEDKNQCVKPSPSSNTDKSDMTVACKYDQ